MFHLFFSVVWGVLLTPDSAMEFLTRAKDESFMIMVKPIDKGWLLSTAVFSDYAGVKFPDPMNVGLLLKASCSVVGNDPGALFLVETFLFWCNGTEIYASTPHMIEAYQEVNGTVAPRWQAKIPQVSSSPQETKKTE